MRRENRTYRLYEKILLVMLFIIDIAVLPAEGEALPLLPEIPDAVIKDLLPVEAVVTAMDKERVILETVSGVRCGKGDLFKLFYNCGQEKTDSCNSSLLSVQSQKGTSLVAIPVDKVMPAELAPGAVAIRFAELTGGVVDKRKNNCCGAYADTMAMDLADMLPQIKWRNLETEPDGNDSQLMRKNALDLLLALTDEGVDLSIRSLPEPRHYTRVAAAQKVQATEVDNMLPAGPIGNFRFSEPEKTGSMSLEAIDILIRDINGDGRDEIITLAKDQLSVSPCMTQGETFVFRLTGDGMPVSCSASGHDGFIAVNRLLPGYGMSSILLKLEDNGLKLIRDDINLWLCFRDITPGGGLSLLGQPWKDAPEDVAAFFYLLQPDARGISYLERKSLPGNFALAHTFMVRFGGYNAPLLCSFDQNGILHIFRNNRLLWSALNESRAFSDKEEPGRINALVYRKGHQGGLLLYQSGNGKSISVAGPDGKGGFSVITLPLPTEEPFRFMTISGDNLFFAIIRHYEDDDDFMHAETVLYRVKVSVSGDRTI